MSELLDKSVAKESEMKREIEFVRKAKLHSLYRTKIEKARLRAYTMSFLTKEMTYETSRRAAENIESIFKLE
jgi:hypothetical protein